MIRALSIAATGLGAQQSRIDDVAHNMANAGTDGFKKTITKLNNLPYQTIKEPGARLGESSQSPVGIQAGTGVRVAGSFKNFETGPAKITNNPYDLMIEGVGFYPVKTPQDEIVYTRSGSFHLNSEGIVTLTDGSKLIPQITVPRNTVSVGINPSGEVKAVLATNEEVILGQIQTVNFQNPQGLLSLGKGLYRTTTACGLPVQGVPGENGLGFIQQGALEASNVNIAESMVDMMTAQRTYEMNAKVMSTADQMWGSLVNVR